MTVDKQELGRRLKTARESARMTQEKVARELDLNRTAITQIESGDRVVSSTELAQLAYLYGAQTLFIRARIRSRAYG